MKVYQIFIDGEETNNYYEAYTEEEAIEEYMKYCIESYIRDFGDEPDLDDGFTVEAIEVQ